MKKKQIISGLTILALGAIGLTVGSTRIKEIITEAELKWKAAKLREAHQQHLQVLKHSHQDEELKNSINKLNPGLSSEDREALISTLKSSEPRLANVKLPTAIRLSIDTYPTVKSPAEIELWKELSAHSDASISRLANQVLERQTPKDEKQFHKETLKILKQSKDPAKLSAAILSLHGLSNAEERKYLLKLMKSKDTRLSEIRTQAAIELSISSQNFSLNKEETQFWRSTLKDKNAILSRIARDVLGRKFPKDPKQVREDSLKTLSASNSVQDLTDAVNSLNPALNPQDRIVLIDIIQSSDPRFSGVKLAAAIKLKVSSELRTLSPEEIVSWKRASSGPNPQISRLAHDILSKHD